ncbi:MAG: hypothetical protein A2293_06180 [Elusimicrobia bacterium RIFOXYB2_FULL_49_7]|nr:MAG: hypothetical protein A2293_06180 [Elusimicrobia bacterium RIFOXYB2_FULL_49_7]
MEPVKKGSEKRTKLRIPFIYGIEFEQAADSTLKAENFRSNDEITILIKDLSLEGIQVVTPHFLPEGTPVKLTLRFPKPRFLSRSKENEFDCNVTAKVRWIDKNKTGKGFRAGLLFTHYEGNARTLINKYLDDNIVIEEEELK